MARLRFLLVCLTGLGLLCPPVFAEPSAVSGTVTAVTLYRDQALVTRSIPVPAGKGEVELVVPDLPAQVVPQSLFAEGGKLAVRSVRFRQRAVHREPDKVIAELDEQMKQLSYDIQLVQHMQQALQQRSNYLNKLENFTAPTAQVEMSKGVLDPKAIAETSMFLFEQRDLIVKQTSELKQKLDLLQEKLNVLQRKRAALGAGGAKTVREAVVFIERRGGKTLKLSYLVNAAGWSPAYNLRLPSGGKAVAAEYLAHVRQTSGEDWSGVKLTLSTASPRMNAQVPVLVPMWVGLAPQDQARREGRDGLNLPQSEQNSSRARTLPAEAAQPTPQARQQVLQQTWAKSKGDQFRAGLDMNRAAAEMQNVELLVSQSEVRRYRKAMRQAVEGVAVSYELDSPISLESRSDRQIVRILSADLPAESYFQATPLLASYVFRAVEMTNDTGQPLLDGPYSAYVDGEFVGQGSLAMIAPGQGVTVGFGIDPQLRVRRELLDKDDKTFLGSRIQTFEYRLTLASYKAKPVAVRVVDRIPTTIGKDMEITLKETDPALSKDQAYLQDDRPKGLLRWDVQVPAGASDEKSVRIDYTYEMKFASDSQTAPTPVNRWDLMSEEYNRRMKQR